MLVDPNTVYLLPPQKEMIIRQRRLLLNDRDPRHGLTLPIDLSAAKVDPANPGAASGKIIFDRACRRLQPSITAASSTRNGGRCRPSSGAAAVSSPIRWSGA